LKHLALIFVLALPFQAKVVTLANAAAVTTIAINVLEIKTTAAKAMAAARATKKTARKIVKKVSGK
jgi:hypothetical protein